MLKCKKTAAFVMSLIICSSTAAPVCTAFADDEEETVTEVTEEIPVEEYEALDESSGYVISGDFSYTLTADGTVRIEDCTSEETELSVPETIDGIAVTELGKTAFGSDADRPYVKISIPASVTYISADNPFMYCPALTEITVDSANTEYCSEDGILYSKDKTAILEYPQAKQGSSLDIPEGVTSIGVAAVYMTSLSEINLPSTLTKINRYGFGSNLRLVSADMSETAVETIDFAAFIECTSLSEVKFSGTLTEIEGAAFALCSALTEVSFPESLLYIGQSAFMETGLTSVKIPSSVTEIGYSAFGYDEEGNADDTFTIIGDYNSAAYTYASDSDEEYGYYNNFQFITPEAYEDEEEYNSFDKDIYGDFEYTAIDGEAMITMCLSSDMVVEVPSEINGMAVTRIYKSAFSGIIAEEIIIPESVKTVDMLAFYNNAYVQTLTVKGAETIGEDAFMYCDALKNLTVSGNCKEIEGDEPFLTCTSLESITVTDGDGEYSSENGVLYNKDKSVLIAYPMAKTDTKFTSPESVKEIKMSAFCYAQNIEEAELPGVEKIWHYAFEGCSRLKNVKLSENLNTVAEYAFADCPLLESVRLYKGLTTIGDCAFGYVTNPSASAEDGSDAMIVLDGFKIYADKDTTAYAYANACGIESVTGTVQVGEKNVVKGFLWTVIGICGAGVIAVIGIFTGRKIRKSSKGKGSKK